MFRNRTTTPRINATNAGTGIVSVYFTSLPSGGAINVDAPYFSISVALNVLLTLMIVVRLLLHSRDIRDAMGSLVRPERLYKAIATILVESSALYAVSFILMIGSWAARSPALNIFIQSLTETQVCAVSALTSYLAV